MRLRHTNIVPLLDTPMDHSFASTRCNPIVMISPWMKSGNLATHMEIDLDLGKRLHVVRAVLRVIMVLNDFLN